MEAIQVSATRRTNRDREMPGPLFQSRFFDRALDDVELKSVPAS